MASTTTRATLRRMVRQLLMSWPKDITTLSGSINGTTSTIVVAAVTNMVARDLIEVGNETMQILSISGTTLTVMRGWMDTTAAAHASGTELKVYAWHEWTNAEINDKLSIAFDWLFPEVWYGKWYANTFLSGKLEFGMPDGVRYPDGEQIKKVEVLADDGVTYLPIYCWRQQNDRLILDMAMDKDRAARIYCVGKHIYPTDDSASLYSDEPRDAIINYTCKLCLDKYIANRSRYVEYSAALNDRAATLDELQRASYAFYNQAVLAKARASRPYPAGFASTRRGG